MFRNLVIICSALQLFSCYQIVKTDLPVFNPSDFDPKLVDASIRNVNENHKVKDFNLINQNGENITAKNYENKI